MRIYAAIAAALVAIATVAVAEAPPSQRPDSHTQPLVDGCQRSDALITMTVPEWVYVNRQEVLAGRLAGDNAAGTQTAEGVIEGIHPAGDDQFLNHDYGDVDIEMALDAKYRGLSSTGNSPPGVTPELGTEWEDTLIPTWAWPRMGDRARESGSWIWDCGHWGNGGADPTMGFAEFIPYDPIETGPDLINRKTLSGESTEIHPIDQLATWRRDAAGVLKGQKTGTELKQLDVWVSGDGGNALAEEECALHGLPPASILAFEASRCPRTRDVGGRYTYRIDLGPKPKSTSKIVVNDVIVHPETDASLRALPVRIRKDSSAGTVTATFDLPHRAAPAIHYGITLRAGWTGAAPAVHHVVTVDAFKVNATLDGPTEPNIHFGQTVGPEQTPDPGEWIMWVAVNGRWQQISPHFRATNGDRFNQVRAGDLFTKVMRFDYWLPQGVAPSILVTGRECDIPLIDCRKDAFGAPPTDLTSPFSEVGFNDKPGRVAFGNGERPLIIGTSTYRPPVNPSATSTTEDLSDHSCGPNACYSITVTAH